MGIWGVASVAYAAFWAVLACDDPARAACISPEERAYLAKVMPAAPPPRQAEGSSGRAGPTKRETLRMLFRPELLSIFAAHMAFNFGVYFITNWSAVYYQLELGLKPAEAAAVVALSLPPLLNVSVKVLMAQPIEDYLRARRGYSTLSCRRFFTGLGFIGSAASLVLAQPSAALFGHWGPVFCLTAAIGFAGLHPSGFKANYLDAVSSARASLVSGVGNTFGTIASFVGPLVLGALLRRSGNWGYVFLSVAVVKIAVAAAFCTQSTATPVDVPAAGKRM